MSAGLKEWITTLFDPGGMPRTEALLSEGLAFCPYWESGGIERIHSLSANLPNDWYTYEFSDESLASWTLEQVLSGQSGFDARAVALLLSPTASLFCSRSPLELELLIVRNDDRGEVFTQHMRRDILSFEREVDVYTRDYSKSGFEILERLLAASHASLSSSG